MKICNPKYEDQIPDLIRPATGTLLLQLTPVPTYPDTIVYEPQLPTGSVIFKAIDPDGRDPEQTPFLRQIGAYLRQIHTLQVEQFGWLDEQHYRQHDTIRGSDPTWRAVVLKDIPASLAYFKQTGAIELSLIETIERLLELADPILDAVTHGQLLHGDLGSLHVWVDPDNNCVTSFVDFGERRAGDPIWDIMQFDWEHTSLLVEGYELDPSLLERFRVSFHVYAVLQAIPWARKWHERGAVHTVDWLNTTIREARSTLGL
jgi:aminoglycoside phosphotransferase (APT) family kinase protein